MPVQQQDKWEINIIIKNPEIVFVADMTRSDAPALVITTQCEIYWKGDLRNDTMTATIKDLQMRACPFLPVKRKGKITTVSLLFNYLLIVNCFSFNMYHFRRLPTYFPNCKVPFFLLGEPGLDYYYTSFETFSFFQSLLIVLCINENSLTKRFLSSWHFLIKTLTFYSCQSHTLLRTLRLSTSLQCCCSFIIF